MTDAMPFAGIATFFKAPFVAEPTSADGDVAVVGVPWDEGTTARPGARYGAAGAARRLDELGLPRRRGGVLRRRDRRAILGGVRFVDAGDIDLAPTAPAEVTHPLIAARVAHLLAGGLFVVALGGDHSITYPVLQGLRPGARRQAAASRPVRHAHGLLGRRGRHADDPRQPDRALPRERARSAQ